MERRPLGATGLDVPVVGMGTWRAFDVRGRDAEARCRAALDAAYDAGATLFDTSPMYGAAECVLAESMAARRDQALVADKLWTTDDREAERQAANALRWYRGRVDVYQVHIQIPYNARDRLAERELPPRGVRSWNRRHRDASAGRGIAASPPAAR